MKTTKAIITIFFTALSIPLFGQLEVENCTPLVNESAHFHLEPEKGCESPLLITTQPGESISVDGDIFTKGGIRFVAGPSGSIIIKIPDHLKDTRSLLLHKRTHGGQPPPDSNNRFADFKANKTVNISPNPTNDILTLKYSKNIQSIQLYNAFGIMIQEEKIQKPSQLVKMNISRQKSGLYTLKIVTSDGRFHHRNIIKN